MQQTLPERLGSAVLASGLPAREVSRRAGLGVGNVQDIIDNRSKAPTVVTIEKLAEVLQVSPAWLAFGQD